MQRKPFLTVILPNYNEAKNIKRGVLDTINNFLSQQDFISEVIVSDDGSTDESVAVIKEFVKSHPNFILLKNSHAGKAHALHSAIKKASGEYVLLTDMDQSTPIKEVLKLIPWTGNGHKVIIGSRGVIRKDSPLYRKLASVVFMLARRAILLPEISDTQCGFKLLDKKLAQDIFAKMQILKKNANVTGWKVSAYDVEMLHLAKKMGHSIKEVPVVWQDEDVSGKKRNFVKESYEMFFEILRVRMNDILGKYA